MKSVFADTFYWIALTNSLDNFNLEAAEFSRTLPMDRIVTTDDILSEYLAFFGKAGPNVRARAGYLVLQLLKNSGIVVVPQSRQLFFAGLALYRDRPDKGYSLTDCISMHIMRQQGLMDVLTNDRHFEQEGFRILF